MSVLASIEPTELQVDAGSESSLTVKVRNRGSIVDRFDIAVVGPMAAWVAVDPPSLRLFPDKEGEARVTFRPPRAANPAADTYPFGVSVRAASDANASTVEEGRVTVNPFVQLTSQIAPQTSRGSRSGSHDLTVRNIGNAVADVSVKATDPDLLLNFDVLPPRVGLRPDGSATSRVRVKPKQTFLMGPAKRIPFSVQIDEPSAGSYQLAATIEQRAIIPGWVKPAAGLLAAAVAAILLLPPLIFPKPLPSPTLVAVVATATPEPTPEPITAPPPTEAPTPEIFGPPDTLTAAGDQNGLDGSMGISFKCPPNDPCRDDIKNRIVQVLGGLGGTAQGAQLAKFSTTVPGTLPIVATWSDRYKYTVNGTPAFAKQVAIDLAPMLAGQPAYAYIQNDDGTQSWYTVPDATAKVLLNDMYVLPAPAPTVDPNANNGGGIVLYHDFYSSALYNGLLLQNIVFAATPPP